MIALTKREKEILAYLASHGPTIGNHMRFSKNIARFSLSLEKKELIERIADKYSPHPHPAMMLHLRVKGLAYALADFFIRNNALRLLDRTTLDELRIIVNQWTGLVPDVFSQWRYFEEKKVGRIAAERLAYASSSIINDIESVERAGHLWNPKKDTTSEEHYRLVFTRFFYDLLYDPTFFRDSYLARWLQSKERENVDIRDAPLILWTNVLKKNQDTNTKVEENARMANGEIERFRLLLAVLEEDTKSIEELEKMFLRTFKVFYE